MLYRVVFTFLAVVIFTLGQAAICAAGTGDYGSGVGGHDVSEHGGGNNGSNENCNFDPDDPGLSTLESELLLFIREEEKVARDSYLNLGDRWGLIVFENISESEQRHMDAIKALITCYGLADPVIDEVGVFTNPELQALYDALMIEGQKSAMDGLKVGALIEETDIVDIQVSIESTDRDHIVDTYESIMCGSRNHLRAFVRQIENNGGSYTPAVLDPATFWEIADSPVEHDCGDY